MCGIIVSTSDIPQNALQFINNRGPDSTHSLNINNINFVHFLLHLTGEKTPQPIIQDSIVCIFNGEIYNYKDIDSNSKSDVYSIIKSYIDYGDDFAKYLDGEFVIILFDFSKNKFFICSDIFKTKPLFYNINQSNIILASYESTCKKIKNQDYLSIKPNTQMIFNIDTREKISETKIHTFDLNQHKTNYNDYTAALEKSILKRYPENGIPLVTLSSGLDSGSIACCLNKYNKESLFISIPKNEDLNTLYQRKEILGEKHIFLDLSDEEKSIIKQHLHHNCEPFVWDFTYHRSLGIVEDGFSQGSMLAKSKMIDYCKKNNQNIKILMSGIGADEIMAHNSYYSLGWGNVDYFPDDLNQVYPWKNFYEGTMDNYIKGDEYIGGCFGFETRYPFCDKQLVQEFLWLKPELKNNYKNSNYKPALHHYLDTNNFFIYHKKLGFCV